MNARRVAKRAAALLWPARHDAELDDEVIAHLELAERDALAAGMSPEEARHEARRQFGGVLRMQEAHRDARTARWIETTVRDVRVAIRSLRRSGTFAIVVILLLALGIGASTTIFAVARAVLLRPLPYPAAERLVTLHELTIGTRSPASVHPAVFLEWRSRARSFDELALAQTPPLNVMGTEGAEQITRVTATADLFRVFGVVPALGRGFVDADTQVGGDQVVILGYGFWQRWFGADPGVLGRQLQLPTGSLTIIGVAPRGFRIGATEPDAFTPLVIDPANPGATGGRAFQCYGRLARGTTLSVAQAEMHTVATAVRQQLRVAEGMGVTVSGLHEFLSRDARPGLQLLLGVVMAVLAIASVNIAGLLIARGASRRSEFAVRVALGASRGRLARQVVTEGILLALAGGLVGLGLAAWLTQGLAAFGTGVLTLDAFGPVYLDATCVLFALTVSGATAMAFSAMPAFQASQAHPESALRAQGRGGSADGRATRARRLLVVIEVAMSVLLLVGAGLLLRTLSNLTRVDLGFEPEQTLTLSLFLGVRPPETRVAALGEILDRVRAVPGVTASGTIQFLPLRGMTCGTGFWHELHAGSRDPAHSLPTSCGRVSRGYFAAMGIPLRAGRDFDDGDRLSSPRVVVVNQAFASTYFPGSSALGRRIMVASGQPALAEIIGVVGDARHTGLTLAPEPTVFSVHAQEPGYIMTLVARTSGDPLALVGAVRRAIHEVDPRQAVSEASSVERDVARSLAGPRLQAWLVAGAAAASLLLATIGVYGLVAYVIALRSREIAIRLALGATTNDVVVQTLWQGAGMVTAGLVIGVGAAFGLRRLLSVFLFGVTSADPATYGVAIGVSAIAALVAMAIPAVRASRIDPSSALRVG